MIATSSMTHSLIHGFLHKVKPGDLPQSKILIIPVTEAKFVFLPHGNQTRDIELADY